MIFIAQDFNFLNVITILDGRTQATIRNHFLRYPRKVRNRVKVITMDMFSPYYQLAKQHSNYESIRQKIAGIPSLETLLEIDTTR